ncbi:UDP-N-acetylmuramate--L-alanine ligase [Legionella sainthelensi]|uniref:UDP-N-acetylmuramate--L-alanine ligase n=1 Tax=Legionella sainthelensi TaxID=28087 RepID=A0A0W0YDJ3_9GAMM|nr:UDP-N-acetylmuramate--L-alanine ligase [Legionella sainthelensi]KTD55017.1 UDP-N-acetylmuramate--L-alanine ligase [Legionella sainthelensi]VEH36503.1 UDP-N-acetylmuramate--L-alanine ligase [Legionella sainthelensi]
MSNSGQFISSRMGCVEQIHFVGIGGVGMCGIAEVLHNQGYRITGSDLGAGSTVQRLKSLGVPVYLGHKAEHIKGADVVVRSSAVEWNNPEIVAAREQMIPVIPRAAMLAELMRFRHGIAVAGTHGKTTTTSLVSSVLAEGGLDPSFVIGGKLNSLGINAQLGQSPYFVVEADESDASFLFLKPMMAIVTNIDADHMGTYENNFEKLRTTFLEFLHHLPFYGLAVVCVDDPEVRKILPLIERPTLTYGFAEEAHYRAIDWSQNELISEFTVIRPKSYSPLKIQFQYPGRHNVLNALASIAIATQLGVDDNSIIRALEKFQGVGRRFQMLGEKKFEKGSAIVVDDYGHHPQEILSTIDAFRHVWPNKRLVHVFQPHRYTRTQELQDQFVDVLSLADELFLFDIYSAGESEIPGVSSEGLAQKIRNNDKKVTLVDEESLKKSLDESVKEGDVILMQGAGSIGQIAVNLMQEL